MDLQSRGMDSNAIGTRQKPEEIILRSMRKLVSDGVWRWNQPGSRLWLIEDSVYIVWRAGVQDLVKGFHEDSITGFDFDADGMADLLVERGIAVACPNLDGKTSRYWRNQLPGIEKTPYLLRLDAGVSISDELPESIDEQSPRASSPKPKRSSPGTPVKPEKTKSSQLNETPTISRECLQILAPLMRGNELRHMKRTPHGLFISHREAAQHLELEVSEFLATVVKENIHQCDPRYPMKPVREMDGSLGILLTLDASEWLESYFGSLHLDPPTAMHQEGMSLNAIMNGALSEATKEKVAERLASKKHKSYGVYDAQ